MMTGFGVKPQPLPDKAPGQKETYRMAYECTNCHHVIIEEFPYGKPAPRRIDKPCPYCGCKVWSNPKKAGR